MRALSFPCLASCLVLSACATTVADQASGPVHPEAEALASLLIQTARSDPARIEASHQEMAALRAALTAPDVADVQLHGSEATVSMPAEPRVDPAPDLSGARSVMSAVHLASYRLEEHAAPGWRELQAQAPALTAGLEPRLSQVDLGERGVFLRLKAGPLDAPEAARALCARFEAAGFWCAPTDFDGAALPPAR